MKTSAPALPPAERAGEAEFIERVALQLEALEAQVRQCTRCGLCEQRQHTVFARGSAQARLAFVVVARRPEGDPVDDEAGPVVAAGFRQHVGQRRRRLRLRLLGECEDTDRVRRVAADDAVIELGQRLFHMAGPDVTISYRPGIERARHDEARTPDAVDRVVGVGIGDAGDAEERVHRDEGLERPQRRDRAHGGGNRVGDIGLLVGMITLYWAVREAGEDTFSIQRINELVMAGELRHFLLLVTACSGGSEAGSDPGSDAGADSAAGSGGTGGVGGSGGTTGGSAGATGGMPISPTPVGVSS